MTGEVWAAIGETVVTRFGPVNVYLAVENMLLQEHRPRLNANHFRRDASEPPWGERRMATCYNQLTHYLLLR